MKHFNLVILVSIASACALSLPAQAGGLLGGSAAGGLGGGLGGVTGQFEGRIGGSATLPDGARMNGAIAGTRDAAQATRTQAQQKAGELSSRGADELAQTKQRTGTAAQSAAATARSVDPAVGADASAHAGRDGAAAQGAGSAAAVRR